MNKIIINALFPLILLVLSITNGICQGLTEPKVIATNRLELLDGSIFVVKDTTVYPLEQSYVQFSSDGINFHRQYVVGDVYFRHSNDSKNTWTIFSTENLTDVLWKRDGNSIYNTNTATATISQNIDVTGQYFLNGDTLKPTDLSASDGSENYVLQVVGGKPKWMPLADGAGTYYSQNVGVGGVATYDGTSGTTFQFRSVDSSNGTVSVTYDSTNKKINLATDPTKNSVTAGVALIGGGAFDASGNVALQFHIPELDTISYQPQDQFAIYRPSDATHYKTTLDINALVGEAVSNTAVKPEDSYIVVQYCDSSTYVPADTSIVINGGLLYNLYSVIDSRGLSNTGWRVPSASDWQVLVDYLGGYLVAGGKLKETGTVYWQSPNTGATNEVGFNARGVGYLSTDYGLHSFNSQYQRTYIHSTTYSTTIRPLVIDHNQALGYVTNLSATNLYTLGFSVRLLKNSTALTHGQTGTYTGNDGTIYRTICIGTQEWLADNLAETKYRNGDAIPLVDDNATWLALTSGAMCYFNDQQSNAFAVTVIPEVPPTCYNDTIYTTQPLNILNGDGIAVDVISGGFKISVDSASYAHWNQAYNNQVTGVSFAGTTTKTLTLTQLDGGTLTASFIDLTGSAGTTTLTNEVTGSGIGTITTTVSDNVIDYGNVHPTLKGLSTDNDGAWDFSANGIVNATISTAITPSFTNLQINKSFKVKLTVNTGGSITGWPTGFKVLEGSATIEVGNTYYIYFDCWNNAVGSELVLVSICKEAA